MPRGGQAVDKQEDGGMNIQEIILNLKAECDGCKVQKAIQALQTLESGTKNSVKVHGMPSKTTKVQKGGLKRTRVAGSSPGSDPKTRTEKACHKCGLVKKLAEYTVNKACKDGHTGECKECFRKRANETYRRKHGKPVEQESDSLDPVICNLCKSVCHGKKRYESHMRAVHGMQAA